MKQLTIMLEPETHTWLIEASSRAGAFPDAFVEELVEQARRQDEAGPLPPLMTTHQGRAIDARNNIPAGESQ